MKPYKVSPQFEPGVNHLQETLRVLRSSRASPALVESILVVHYGTQMRMRDLASISVADARTIVIEPWNASAIPTIEKALAASSLGVLPTVVGKIIRLTLPLLTQERRRELVKLVSQHAESARISVRNVREKLLRDLKRRHEDGDLSDDVLAREKDMLQDAVNAALETIATLAREKEGELLAP